MKDVNDGGEVRFGRGFHAPEADESHRSFRWMERTGLLEISAADRQRFLELGVLSEFFDLSQAIVVHAGDDTEVGLVHGWNRVSVPVAPGCTEVVVEASTLFPPSYYPGDSRRLSVRVREPLLHDESARHRATAARHANAVLNVSEMLAGATVLASTPPVLGIDLHGRCNVKPPCVFCEWDEMKAMEGENAATPFTVATLDGFGPFYANASLLVNCSIGEPFMMRDLDPVLDRLGGDGKAVEMSTNGQILSDETIARLLGRDVVLYVSLDAATPETYARFRNDSFPRIVDNLRRVTAAKGGRGGLPHLNLVFMPMRANAEELLGFVRLCAELEADRLVLRPLNDSPGSTLRWTRGGHEFVYQREILPYADLVRLSGKAEVWCRHFGVPLSNQLDFGPTTEMVLRELYEQGRDEALQALDRAAPSGDPSPTTRPGPEPDLASHPTGAGTGPAPGPEGQAGDDAAPADVQEAPGDLGHGRWPVCTEPWRTLYVLRRGILPCCYGAEPIAPAGAWAEAWNGRALQSLRWFLSRGRFSSYCLNSSSCPIVSRYGEARRLTLAERILRPVHRGWVRFNRATGEVPHVVLRPLTWTVSRFIRACREPRYAVHHVKRILGLKVRG